MKDAGRPTLQYAPTLRSGKYLANTIFALLVAIFGALICPLPLLALWIGNSVLKNSDKIDPSTRRLAVGVRGIAIASSVISVLVLILFITSIFFTHPRVESPRVWCASNMRQIGLALLMYANQNNDCFPPDLATVIRTQEITPDVFICPSSNDDVARSKDPATVIPGTSHCSYIYFPDPALRNLTVSPDRIMLIEPLSNHDGEGMNVLYADDHVDWMDKTEASRVMAQLLIGHNPPWPPTSQSAVAAAATRP